MKISVVTPVYNGAKFIESCILSVHSQNHPDKEHIVIDGGSNDGTIDIIRKHADKVSFWRSEPDKGIYQAINKGLSHVTGEVVGVLNSDDFFAHEKVLSRIATEFAVKQTDSVFGDLVYVDPLDTDRITRYYSPARWTPRDFRKGDMPPHPTFYARMKFFQSLGNYREDYKICADFELMLRFILLGRLSYSFIPEVLVKMRTGGVSTRGLSSTVLVNKEMLRACKENHVQTSLFLIYSKYFTKAWQLFSRPGALSANF